MWHSLIQRVQKSVEYDANIYANIDANIDANIGGAVLPHPSPPIRPSPKTRRTHSRRRTREVRPAQHAIVTLAELLLPVPAVAVRHIRLCDSAVDWR